MKGRLITHKRRQKKIILLAGLFTLITAGVIAQTNADSIILTAMRDELTRNYRELSSEEVDGPFFIGYTIADARTINISATLGALNYSSVRQYKDWHVRLMVGDYKINDENFYSTQPEETVFRQRIAIPVDNDYQGIRRSLWLTTNNLFHSASRKYKNKMALIENKQITESDLEIDDFSRESVVNKKIYHHHAPIDMEDLEKKARHFSAYFAKFPEIHASSVQINLFESTVYFVNSEGSEIQFPFSVAVISIQAQTMADDSDYLSRSIDYVAREIPEWPSEEKISEDIEIMLTDLLELRETPRFEDDYFGPVLVVGEVAAETMEKFLFSGSDALIATRETLQSGSQQSVYYSENENSLQAKIGKPVVANNMTITAEPLLMTYDGVDLLGHFEVDAEAVIPEERLVLVENGVLKTLLNGRTPSREVPKSNGHMRFDYSQRGLDKTVGPGVIRISTTDTFSLEELKNELILQASELGLEYAILIRSLEMEASQKPYNIYRVDVQTGEEKKIRAVKFRNLNRLTFRRAPRFSEEEQVHNTLLPLSQSAGRGIGGMPSSFILPEAVLLKDVELESQRKSLTSLLPLIENPVSMYGEDKKAFSSQDDK